MVTNPFLISKYCLLPLHLIGSSFIHFLGAGSKKNPKPVIFCPVPRSPQTRDESTIDKIRSALGNEYSKPLNYCIGHLRRADGALRPKTDRTSGCSMNLLAQGDTVSLRLVARSMLREPDFASQGDEVNSKPI